MIRLELALYFILSSCIVYAQEVTPSFKYSPERTYEITHDKTSDITMVFKGDTVMENKMKAAGASFPLNMKSESHFISLTKTGKRDSLTFETPVNIIIKDFRSNRSINDQIVNTPITNQDSLLTGKLLKSGVIYIDTAGIGRSKYRKTIISMFNSLRNQVSYPNKAMKPGDLFTQNIPLSVPVPVPGSKPVLAQIQIVYHLKEISNNKAYFDVDMAMQSDDDISKTKEVTTGKGSGKLVYDIKENFILSYVTNIQLTMDMQMDLSNSFSMSLLMTSTTKTVIGK